MGTTKVSESPSGETVTAPGGISVSPITTAVSPGMKLSPMIVTVVPTGPSAGVMPVMTGTPAVTVNASGAVEPPGVVATTVVGPSGKSSGTTNVSMLPSSDTVTASAGMVVEPSWTVVSPERKWSPWTVTTVPSGPLGGVSDVAVGATAVTVKSSGPVEPPSVLATTV